jgi:thiosulfate dehydrogenase [quinone] large subunit
VPSDAPVPAPSRFQAIALVVLRTLIGWHFLYEGFYKLMLPGWTRAGVPIGRWSAVGYLQGATGPAAGVFRWLAHSTVAATVDWAVPVALLLVGLSLMLGLLTRTGLWGALALLSLFYVSAIPVTGVPAPGQEGTYLLVSKNLIELAAVAVLLTFDTGRIAGLDLLRRRRRLRTPVS